MAKDRIRMGFVTADAELIRKLDILSNEYGVSLNSFFTKIIAEKLQKLGCSFDDKSVKEKPKRKISTEQYQPAEQMWKSLNDIRSAITEIQMRKK